VKFLYRLNALFTTEYRREKQRIKHLKILKVISDQQFA